MNGIDDLAALICGLRSEDIAADTLEKLRLHVADTTGAWIAAKQTAEGKALIAFRDSQRSMPWSTGNSLHDDLANHCALVRLSEVDDIHLASMTTPGSIAIPAAMTLAAAMPHFEIADVIVAMLVGYEAMIRLGLAVKGPNILDRGIWPTYFAAGFATAAVAARLMRLDQHRTENALALALTMAAPSVGQHHAPTTARWLSVGNAARNGLTAAFAAKSGFTTDTGVLQSRLFPDVYGIEPDLAVMSGRAGGALEFSQVSFKPWCAARQTMAATHALREILQAGIVVSEISEVEAHVLSPHLKMIDHGVRIGDRASFLTSLPYQLAVAATKPDDMFDLNQSPTDALPAIQDFMARVRVTADDTLLVDYPNTWPARVTVTTPLGRYDKSVSAIPGDTKRGFTASDIRAKFERVLGAHLGEDAIAELWRCGLGTLDSREALLSTASVLASQSSSAK